MQGHSFHTLRFISTHPISHFLIAKIWRVHVFSARATDFSSPAIQYSLEYVTNLDPVCSDLGLFLLFPLVQTGSEGLGSGTQLLDITISH